MVLGSSPVAMSKKHCNIINSRKTNFRLIGNITVHVPNTASISEGIFFHVPKFLEKMIFQLMYEITKCIRQHVLKDFAIFTGKQLCWSLFLITLPALKSAALLERDSITGIFLW